MRFRSEMSSWETITAGDLTSHDVWAANKRRLRVEFTVSSKAQTGTSKPPLMGSDEKIADNRMASVADAFFFFFFFFSDEMICSLRLDFVR